MRFLTSTLVGLLLCGSLFAQIGNGEQGLHLAKKSGSAGVLCSRQFQCQHLPTILRRGEQVTMSVRGVYNRPFAVLVGIGRPPFCIQFPGIENRLVSLPLVVPFVGVLSLRDTIRACPGGLQSFTFNVPTNLTPGARILFQGLAWSYIKSTQLPTFTVSIEATVK